MKKITKLKEVICYEENEIKVFVEIDYAMNKISLIEPSSRGCSGWLPKQYLFNGRGVEFMNSWVNVLQAMQNAIKLAKSMYEKELAEESKFSEDFIIKNSINLTDDEGRLR